MMESFQGVHLALEVMMSRTAIRTLGSIVALTLVAAACGSSGDDSTAAAEASTSTAESEAPAATEPPAEPVEDTAETAEAALNPDWTLERIGAGIKPALATTADGGAALAYLTEAIEGGVFYATAADGWEPSVVAEGYFYGPLDLAFDPDGVPNVVYHDHQGSSFRPDAGDLTLATRSGDAWSILASGSPGHDGWDSTIRFGPNGELWAAGIEPVDFGTQEGVEFYELTDGEWVVESIGGPAITYEFNVSVATGAAGEPVLSYYDDQADQLHVATRTAGGWVDETVTEGGGGGMFSSLVITADGTRHITFFSSTESGAGDVKYAFDDGSGWQVETINTLDDVVLGMTGARRITSLQFLDDGTPIVASTDRGGVWVSSRTGGGWETEPVFTAGERVLGQQIQLVVNSDKWMLTTFEVTSPGPLEGEILYLERSL